MATVWIPSLLRPLTQGVTQITIDAATVGALIDALDEQYPGFKARVTDGDRIRPGIAVVIDGISNRRGLRQTLEADSEVHFVPAMSGGAIADDERPVGAVLPVDVPIEILMPDPPSTPPQSARVEPSRTRQLLPLIFAGVVTIIAAIAGVYYRDKILALGEYGLIGVFLINLINNATVILPAPFGLLAACLFAGTAPILLVGLAAGLGSGLGEYTAYLAGSGGNAVIPHGRIYVLMQYYMRRAGPIVILLLSAIPNPLFDIGGLIAGALKMPVGTFMVMTIIGKVLRYWLVTYLCASGSPILDGWISQ
jgi:membrane protein YqaA with SNARE-associated domain/molybdopterin converting factor small subunit